MSLINKRKFLLQFNLWFFIWLIVSIGLLSFSAWTFVILMRQKKSWREFAKKFGLRYKNASLMMSPQVSGVYKGHAIWLFTGEHESERGGANRKLTAIEVELDSRMPVDGAIASGGMVGIVQELNYSDEVVPSYKFWKGDYIIRCSDKIILNEYLTEERAQALCTLMDKKNIWMIFIFRGNDTILRIDTPEPFESVDKLTKTIDMMVEVARTLELGKGESGRLKRKTAQRQETSRVEIEDEQLSVIGLELEEEEATDKNDNGLSEETAAQIEDEAEQVKTVAEDGGKKNPADSKKGRK